MTIAMVKVKLIPDIYPWAIVLINELEESAEKQFLTSWGGQNSLLMLIPLWCMDAPLIVVSRVSFLGHCDVDL